MNGAELAAKAGITYRQLDHWSRTGLIAAVNEGSGSGHDRDFSATESRVTCRMAGLVRAGMTPRAAALVAREDARAVAELRSALGWSA